MSKFFSRLKFNTAMDNRSTFDLSCDHVTTMDFFVPKISYFNEVVPGSDITIKNETFVKLAPLAVPTFGRMEIVHRAFFVPMRTIWSHFNEFITNNIDTYKGSVIESVPYITNEDFVECLREDIEDHNDFLVAVDHEKGQKHDIAYVDTSAGHIMYAKFTVKGRILFDILNNVGFKSSLNCNDTSPISMLPLMAYWKVLQDWYKNNQYGINISFDTFIRYNENVNYPHFTLSHVDLLEIVYLGQYAQDYFTSAFNNPVGPNQSAPQPSFSFPDQVLSSSSQTTNLNNKSEATVKGTSGHSFSQYNIDALHALSDFLKRYQISGSRVIDRFLARFGVQPEDAKLNRTVYLGSNRTNIQIGEVTSQSATDDAVLGDYAGRGQGYSTTDKGFHISSKDDYGYVIIISQVVPKIGYTEGIPRHSLHLTPSDFFSPEFEHLGTQAIPRKELYCSLDVNNNDTFIGSNKDAIFGYINRYAEYKCSRDILSGNFLFATMNTGEDSWYSFRKVRPTLTYDPDHPEQTTVVVATPNTASAGFLDPTTDLLQYHRMFNSSQIRQVDLFRVIMHFDVKANLPMSSLYDTYDFVNKGKEVSMEINGTNLNA